MRDFFGGNNRKEISECRLPSSDCPVNIKIDENTDVSKDDFQLKSSDGTKWPINKLTNEQKQWIEERYGTKPKKG